MPDRVKATSCCDSVADAATYNVRAGWKRSMYADAAAVASWQVVTRSLLQTRAPDIFVEQMLWYVCWESYDDLNTCKCVGGRSMTVRRTRFLCY